MPQIEWRGGTCRVKWETGERYPNGRRKLDSKGGFTDEEEALDYGKDREHELRHGRLIKNKSAGTPMDEWCDTWLGVLDHAANTERSYRGSVDNHIRTYFDGRTVGELDVLSYRAFKKHLGQVLGAGSARNVLMVFGMMMNDAVDVGLRSSSPVERTRRRGRYKKKPLERKRHMQAQAVYRLAENAKLLWGFPGYVFVLTMAFTGMRPAELYGLRREYCPPNWPASDPDPEGEHAEPEPERYRGAKGMPAIRVQQQHLYDANYEPSLEPPKFDSYRTLVVPPFLARLLALLLVSHGSEWVFPSRTDGPLLTTNFDQTYWRPIADGQDERSGPRIRYKTPEIVKVPEYAGKRMYLLRHGHKEWLDDSGRISRPAVESRMGHELAGVERVYSNVTPAMEAAIMEVLQERWVEYMGLLRLPEE